MVQPPFVHGILLAAGASKRFGDAKLSAELDGKALISHTIARLSSSELDAFSVVLGANAEKIAQLVPTDIPVIHAAHWGNGMGASIACGVENLPVHVTHLYVALADQVEISEKQCNLLIRAAKKHPYHIITSRFVKHGVQHLGAPAIFPRQLFTKLSALNSDKGARSIIANTTKRIEIDIAEAALDIDTQEDLRLLRERFNA